MATSMTIATMVAEFERKFKASELKLPINSYKSTMKDVQWLDEIAGGKDRDITTITHLEIEALMDRVRFGKNRRGEDMKESGAASVFYSTRRLFAFAVDEGFLTESPFEKVAWDAIPRVTSKQKTVAPTFNEEQGKIFVMALVNTIPTYSAVKACLFSYIAYRYKRTPGELLLWTWEDYDAFIATINDEFLIKLVANYHEALNHWLTEHNVKNAKNLFFVKNKFAENKAETEAEPMDSGFVGTWIKDNILDPKSLPRVTTNKLCSTKIPSDVFDEVDAMSEFPILGTITFPKAFGSGGPHYNHEAYKAATEARRAAFEAKNKTANSKEEN